MTEEKLLLFIFSNQLVFCSVAGLMGGIVQALELGRNLRVSHLISKLIVSFSGGTLVFFATYDMSDTISPSLRITLSLLVGYCGSSIFKKLARRQLGVLTLQDEEDRQDNRDDDYDKPKIDLRRKR